MIEINVINDKESEYYSVTDDRDGFLVILPQNCSYNDFEIATKVRPDSYGSVILSRLFHGLVTTSINVKEQYEKYYLKEYDNIIDFLFWRYCIPRDMSNLFLSQQQRGEVLLFNTFSSGCSWTVRMFLEDQKTKEAILKTINEVRRIYHENSK